MNSDTVNQDRTKQTPHQLPLFSEFEVDLSRFRRETETDSFGRYASIIRRLRGPDGCPWDRKQSLRSLRRYIIEESFELLAAIDSEDTSHIAEELGDVLLVLLMIADALEVESGITLETILSENGYKLIRRHPHVFGDIEANTSETVVANWNKIKKETEGRSDSPLDAGVGLPPLEHAYEIQKKAAKLGFDWTDISPALGKIEEELTELREEIARIDADGDLAAAKDDPGIEKEIGDLLFSVVNVGRRLKTDPSVALAVTNRSFLQRFAYIERSLAEVGREFEDTSLAELDQLWNEAKQSERER